MVQPRGAAYENSTQMGPQDILVLWLNEADLKGQPLSRISSLIRKIRGYRGEVCVPEDGKILGLLDRSRRISFMTWSMKRKAPYLRA